MTIPSLLHLPVSHILVFPHVTVNIIIIIIYVSSTSSPTHLVGLCYIGGNDHHHLHLETSLHLACLRMSHLSHFSTHSLIYPDLKSTPWYIAIKKSQIRLKFLSRHPLPDIFIFPLSSNSVKSPKFTNSYFQGAAFITWQEHFPKSGCQITKSNWITMSVSKIDVGVKIFAFRHPIKW